MQRKFMLAMMLIVIFLVGCGNKTETDPKSTQMAAQTDATQKTTVSDSAAKETSQSSAVQKLTIETATIGPDPAGDVVGKKQVEPYLSMADILNVEASLGSEGLNIKLAFAGEITESDVRSNNFAAGTGIIFVLTLAQMDDIYDDYNKRVNTEVDRFCQISVFSDLADDGKYWLWQVSNNKDRDYANSPIDGTVSGLDTKEITVTMPQAVLNSDKYLGKYNGNKLFDTKTENMFYGCGFENGAPVYLKIEATNSVMNLRDEAPKQKTGFGSVWYKV